MPRQPFVLAALIPAVLFAFARATPAVVAQSGDPPLQWAPCDDLPDVECATIEVPVDHARPDGPQIPLRLGWLPNTDPEQKRGALLIIPGGPGPGIQITLVDYSPAQHLDEVRRFYDVVSFDPRGIGRSNPLRCAPELVPPVIAPFDRPPTREEFEASARATAAFFRSCFELTGELMAHLSAMDTADDIERIRQALGLDDGLVAYGGSYGSGYGAAYLERYGDRVKTLVLDAITDHSIDLTMWMTGQILSVQAAFDRFASWCAREPACALHSRDVGAAFDAAIAAAPIVRKLVPQLLALGNDPETGWSLIARMLVEVVAGDTATLDELTRIGSLDSTDEDPQVRAGKNAIIPGVFCNDYGPQRDYAALLDASATAARLAPRFAWKFWVATPLELATAGVALCAGWPIAAGNPPHRLPPGGSYPNVLVANAAYDPPTPPANAFRLWLQLPEARLLIADADGHQSWIVSRCAFEAQLRFLLDPASAPPYTICPGGFPAAAQDGDALFRELDAKIEAAMARYQIPGVAVGVFYQGQEYVRGYGVTNVDYPQPVDGDTLFRIGSTTTRPCGRGYGRLLSMPCVDTARPVPFPVMPTLPGPSRFFARPQLLIRYAPLP
jgi:pimeloyl-ACP methyl ester carboxylesterase